MTERQWLGVLGLLTTLAMVSGLWAARDCTHLCNARCRAERARQWEWLDR